MKCPFCNQDNTRVIDSRPVPDNNSIRRRRQCDECGRRFTTYEKIETIPLTVIKKDQSREEFDRGKLQNGVMRACYKRPIPVKRIEELIDEIETEVFNKEEREVPSTVIGEIVMEKLKELDTDGVEPLSHIFEEENVFREDVVVNGDEREAILYNAPKAKEGQFQVPRTIG